MARKGPQSIVGPPAKGFELLEGGYQTGTTVGTTAVPLPATNLTNRCGIYIQNQNATYAIYVASPKPINYKDAAYEWTKSGSGTNEWYLQLVTGGGDPSLSETLKCFTQIHSATSESEATAGTVGSLTAGQWDWGDNDTLGYSTIYACTDGKTAKRYFTTILGYDRMPTTSGATVGILIEKAAAAGGSNNSLYLPLSGNTRLFAIGAGASITVCTIEFEPGGNLGI